MLTLNIWIREAEVLYNWVFIGKSEEILKQKTSNSSTNWDSGMVEIVLDSHFHVFFVDVF